MDRGWAASPAQTAFLPRMAPPRLPEILAAWNQKAEIAPPPPRYVAIKNPPLTRGEFKDRLCAVQWVAGGDLGTRSLRKRETVGNMAREAGVQAALNGAFFSEIRLRTLGSAMMGPTLCRADNQFSPATLDEDARLEGRPLVLIGPQKCLVLPYAEHLGHSREILQTLMPDVTDAFLAGGWIVHHGKAVSPELLTAWSSHDANDFRHRVFAGIDSQHRFVLGGTQSGIGTAALAKTLEKMGIEEAWLMDSGYCSALVWQNKILISGHNDRATPSRPVPHALFLYGDPAPDAPPPPADALPASGPGAATTAEAFAAEYGTPGRPQKEKARDAPPLPRLPACVSRCRARAALPCPLGYVHSGGSVTNGVSRFAGRMTALGLLRPRHGNRPFTPCPTRKDRMRKWGRERTAAHWVVNRTVDRAVNGPAWEATPTVLRTGQPALTPPLAGNGERVGEWRGRDYLPSSCERSERRRKRGWG